MLNDIRIGLYGIMEFTAPHIGWFGASKVFLYIYALLFILSTSANILYASNRYTPNQDTYIDEVLYESVHCS